MGAESPPSTYPPPPPKSSSWTTGKVIGVVLIVIVVASAAVVGAYYSRPGATGTSNLNSCSNGAINYPSCNSCANGQVLAGGSCQNNCTNGATNPPSCTNFATCSNGASNPPACTYRAQFDLVIQKKTFDASGQVVTTTILPAAHIGEPGGYMYTQQYIADGAGGNYPIHTVDTSGIVYIDSKVVRSYTIGDFFAVWGEPLGVNNTLGFKANYSSTLRTPYVWSMCIRTPSGGDAPEPAWGAHVIRDKEIIDLLYAQLTCAPVPPCQYNGSISSHVYNPSRLQIVKQCITAQGMVERVIEEADGDVHLRLVLDPVYSNLTNTANDQYQYGDLVVEIICVGTVTQPDAVSACQGYTNTIPVSNVGEHITVTGPYVLDTEHSNWAEIHPVYSLSIGSPISGATVHVNQTLSISYPGGGTTGWLGPTPRSKVVALTVGPSANQFTETLSLYSTSTVDEQITSITISTPAVSYTHLTLPTICSV